MENARRANFGTSRLKVSEDLHRMIISGELSPGTKLRQSQLAKQFGVSVNVIRESLLDVQSLGLVQSFPNMGMRVADLSVNTVLEAFEVREFLEGLAARLCCRKANREDIEQLTDIANRFFTLCSEGDAENEEALSLDRAFHQRIIEIAGNRMLERVAQNCWALGPVGPVSPLREPSQLQSEHLAIIDAIANNQPEQAEAASRQHVRAACEFVSGLIESGAYVPPWEQEAPDRA